MSCKELEFGDPLKVPFEAGERHAKICIVFREEH